MYRRGANGPPTYRARQRRTQDLFSPRKDFRKQNLRSLNSAVCCPPSVGARERSPRLARLFSLETRLKSVVSAESFCLGLDCVPRFSAVVSLFYHLRFYRVLAAGCYNATNLNIMYNDFVGINLLFTMFTLQRYNFRFFGKEI